MPARIIVIGLDAFESTVVERAANTHRFPTLAALERRGAKISLANSVDVLPAAIWPEISTGQLGAKLGLFFYAGQIPVGEATTRCVREEELDAEDQFWVVAGRHGKKVVAVDIPQSVVAPDLGGAQLIEWGAHDIAFTPRSDPPQLRAELLARYGRYPLRTQDVAAEDLAHYLLPCDVLAGTGQSGLDQLRTDLRAGLALKTRMLSDLLAREDWDLFVASFSEAHCAGHHFWAHQDPTSPFHDPDTASQFGDALVDIQAGLDAAVGELVEQAGPDATVLVLASHGMGPYVAGYHLLPEVLHRLGYGPRLGRLLEAKAKLPHLAQAVLNRLTPPSVALRQGIRHGWQPHLDLEEPSTRAAVVPNGRCGAVRLNLVGREPNGSVRPGAEAEALLHDLHDALLELRDPRSGEPIVTQVTLMDEAFGSARHPAAPDLVCDFRDDLAPIRACESPRVGRIEVPLWRAPDAVADALPRTGDHTPVSRLWAAGPGIDPTRTPRDANVLDIAPTVLRLLGVPEPPDLDGHALDLAMGAGVA